MKGLVSTTRIGFPRRARIDVLLSQGLQHPLLLIEAAPGYGKTEAVLAHLEDSPYRYVWMRLGRMDNLEYSFWKHFQAAGLRQEPVVNRRLREIEFPDTLRKTQDFLDLMAQGLEDEERLVMVVDDYSILVNPKIKALFESIIECNLPRLCLILISSQRTDLSAICLKNNVDMFYIGANDLRYTGYEVQALFRQHHMEAPEALVDSLLRDLDGWPLAVWLAMESYVNSGEEMRDYSQMDFSVINQLFETGYYTQYPEGVRRMLVKLSAVDRFNATMICELGDYPLAGMERLLAQNPFVCVGGSGGTYRFYGLYRQFLAQKQPRLSAEEWRAVHRAAARMLEKKDRLEEALPYFFKSGDYDDLVRAAWELADMYADQSLTQFLRRQVAQLQQAYVAGHPSASLLRATLALMLLDVDGAERELRALAKRMQGSTVPQEIEFLGETQHLLAAISILRNREDFVEHFRIASQCLPHGSRFRSQTPYILAGASPLMLADNKPGALQRMEKCFAEVVPYMRIVLNGSGPGLDLLFSAEAAYATYDLDLAVRRGLETLYMAEANQQHEMVVLGRYLLGRIASLNGDLAELERQAGLLVDYADKHQLDRLAGLRDRCVGFLYLRLGQPEKISLGLIEEGTQKSSRFEAVPNGIFCACYLVEREKYTHAVALLQQLEDMNKKRGSWMDMIYMCLFRAVSELRLGNSEVAASYLYKAYDRTHANNIITPFIECAGAMRALVDTVRRTPDHGFDEGWLDTVHTKSSSFSKRLAANKMAGNKRRMAIAESKGLTARKMEILRCLAQGFTQEEIAKQFYISINTVKSHVKGIYDELGAVNRADAIRIATAMKLI